MDSVAGEVAATLQTASLNRAPSPKHDINPSTAASRKEPVRVTKPTTLSSPPASPSAIPITVHPQPRTRALPPLPDLRFEQSYLASIPPGASHARIAWITVRDQVLAPLVQGMAWTLLLAWWRYWNRGAQMAGHGVGARVRRWWWGVNGWKLPKATQIPPRK